MAKVDGDSKQPSDKKSDRGYFDGCFDLCHSGHFNAIRQAASTVNTLLVGPNSDEQIMRYKGPTIMNGQERADIVRAIKWGDIVVPDTPYECTTELLDQLNCQYFVHGDDPVMCDGVNVNELLKSINRFKEVRRTTGISTTDLTGKLLDLLKPPEEECKQRQAVSERIVNPPKQTFLQTSTRIANFSNRREPGVDEQIVYFQASCDLMHPGVIARIHAAKAEGDFLYVGLWDDEMIKYYRGSRYPLQGMQERLLMALAMKDVDDVVIGAPYIITDDLIKSLNIKKVVHVRTREDQVKPEFAHLDPFEVPKAQNIFVELPAVENDLTLEDIARRVEANRDQFENKFNKRKAKQDDYYLNLKRSVSQLKAQEVSEDANR